LRSRKIVGSALIVRAIVVVKGRNREQRIWVEGVNPGESDVAIRLALAIAQAIAGIDGVSD